jgi:hypothetical protein
MDISIKHAIICTLISMWSKEPGTNFINWIIIEVLTKEYNQVRQKDTNWLFSKK